MEASKNGLKLSLPLVRFGLCLKLEIKSHNASLGSCLFLFPHLPVLSSPLVTLIIPPATLNSQVQLLAGSPLSQQSFVTRQTTDSLPELFRLRPPPVLIPGLLLPLAHLPRPSVRLCCARNEQF